MWKLASQQNIKDEDAVKYAINYPDHDGHCALHYACRWCYLSGCCLAKHFAWLEYFSVCRYNRLEVVKLLVMRGADIDRRTEIGGLAPLHLSAMSVMDRINFVSKSCSLIFLFKIIICNCDFLGGQPCPAC